MGSSRRGGQPLLRTTMTWLGILLASCARGQSGPLAAPAPPQAVPSQGRPDEVLPPPAPLGSGAGPGLSLERLVELATQRHPDIAIAQARALAARGRLIQAGLYPNPTFTWEAEDVGSQHQAAGKQGPILGQEIVTLHKLKIARAAAAHGVALADWQALTRRYEVVTRARLAYFELLTAQQEVRTADDIVGLAQMGLDAAQKLVEAKVGTRIDVLRAQVELEQTRVQRHIAEQRLEAARRLLAVAVGVPELANAPVLGSLERPVADFQWEPVRHTVLTSTSPIQETQAAILQAEELVRLARAQRFSNVQTAVRPLYTFPEQRVEVTATLGLALPIYNKNQGNILSAEADLLRTREEVRQTELRLEQLLATAFQRYLSARRQSESYRKQVLPNAVESLRLVRLGYERGDIKYDYTSVLQAQRTLSDARLIYVRSLGDLWRALSEIGGLLQLDNLSGGCQGAADPG